LGTILTTLREDEHFRNFRCRRGNFVLAGATMPQIISFSY